MLAPLGLFPVLNLQEFHHKFLGKLIQPGGHVDPEDESIEDAAIREIHEEVGISDLVLLSETIDGLSIPIAIDIHIIPSNPKKEEREHYHYDFRYVFKTNGEHTIEGGYGVEKSAWLDLEEFGSIPEFSNIKKEIEILLDKQTQTRYNKTLT